MKAERYVWAMNHGGETFLVAHILNGGGTLAGFCSYDSNRIHGLYIRPESMGRGLASAMLERAEAAIEASGAEQITLTASLIARPLYERRGYAIVRRADWKTRGGLVMDAFDMVKQIALRPRATV